MASLNRKELILNCMRDKNFVTVEYLCSVLYVSGATIRRDLKELEESRQIRRTRGGALLIEGIANEDPLAMRENRNEMQKQIIASQACKFIKDGMTLFLDSSSTVFILARNLDQFSNLRIITNGVKTVLLLSDRKDIAVMCTGGSLRSGSKSLVGQSAVEYAGRFNADAVFMSSRGFSLSGGSTEASEDEYFIKREFISKSKEKYLLCDTSKMNSDYLCRTAPLTAFTEVITESQEVNALCRKHKKESCAKRPL
ncbi:MAG: DeoR/GlpR family DNA-binding transcription regulator [Clostridiales bacterium]|nr:DeoR/GlpR family DNA-binding transcription regulator [Clostridiales bacterium]